MPMLSIYPDNRGVTYTVSVHAKDNEYGVENNELVLRFEETKVNIELVPDTDKVP